MADDKKYSNRGITARLREHFEKQPGTILYVSELAEEYKVDERVIQQTVANLRRENNGQPLVHITARAWVYQPGAQPKAKADSTRLFEYLATTKDGSILIQDEQGQVYRAVEL